jgi:YggT family protein
MPAPIFWLIIELLQIYSYVVLAAVVASWLVSFGVINGYNPAARSILRLLDALTEPVFRQARKILPQMGGLDISPVLVFIGILFLQQVVVWLADRYAF